MYKIFLVIVSFLLLTSCSELQKALKSEDVGLKYSTAEKLYEAGKYKQAIRLFDQIATSYRGKPQAEKMFYMYSQAYYKTNQFYLAGYQFENFTSTYPKSEKAEEAMYLSAYCYSQLSPTYSLDQTDTYKAMEKLQAFIDKYPNSQYIPQINESYKELKYKIEKKEFEIAKQFYTIEDYKGAIVAFDNFISDFPGTPLKEDALYYKFDSEYIYAINSIENKMSERLTLAETYYNKLIQFKSDTKYKEKADKRLEDIKNRLNNLNKTK
ncbi:MAG: outer membrane protein assembly factor BamD [Flavobacterium sp.]|jgi:outer membrane protein assembly factor BamD